MLDSRVLVLEDPRLRAATAGNLSAIATHSYWWPYAETPLYRPLTTLSFLINYSTLGHQDRPAGYHALNLVLHLVNVLLVWAVARRIVQSAWLALAVAAVWAVHPLGTEAVTNIVGRADLLAATGILTALLAYWQSAASHGRARAGWLGVVAVVTLAAAFSKENSVALLGVVVLWDLLRVKRQSLATTLSGWLAVGLPIAIFLAVRSTVVTVTTASFPFVDNPILGATWLTGRLTALAVTGRYVLLFLWPGTLSADYSFQQIPLSTGTASDWLFWTLAAGAIVAILLSWRVGRPAFFCAVAAALFFLPASNLLFASGTIMAERVMYVPAAFLLLAVAAALDSFSGELDSDLVIPSVLALVAVVCAARTFVRNRDWKDELSLWTATVQSAPASFKSHSGLAEALRQADKTGASVDRIVAEKDQSLAILERSPDPSRISKALYEAATYRMERAERRATEPGVDRAALLNEYQSVITLVDRFLASRPEASDAAAARLLQSAALRRMSRADNAVDTAQQAAAADPLNPIVYRALAGSLVAANRQDEAAQQLMVGYMLTGSQDLRDVLIELYQGGLDTSHCAVTRNGDRVVLNSSCDLVRRHLCFAAEAASRVHQSKGRSDLAAQALAPTRALDCAAVRVP